MKRNFGIPSSQGNLAGPTDEAQSFIRDNREFAAGLFAGLVLGFGPLAVITASLIYLFVA